MKKLLSFFAIASVLFALPCFAADIGISWPAAPASDNVTNYRVYWSAQSNPSEVFSRDSGIQTSMAIDAMYFEPGATYEIWVSGMNNAGEGEASDHAPWSRPLYSPPAVNEPTVVYKLPGKLTITITP